MKTILKFLCYLFLVGFLPAVIEAKEWRGIIPFQSTRSDVIRILGEINDQTGYRAQYKLDEGRVSITFTNVFNEGDKSVNLPPDMVYMIVFHPKVKIPLADLKLDLETYTKFNPAFPKNSGYDAYLNKKEGLLCITRDGNVAEMRYYPDAEKQKLYLKPFEHLQELTQIILN